MHRGHVEFSYDKKGLLSKAQEIYGDIWAPDKPLRRRSSKRLGHQPTAMAWRKMMTRLATGASVGLWTWWRGLP
jgi:hypothetical protein